MARLLKRSRGQKRSTPRARPVAAPTLRARLLAARLRVPRAATSGIWLRARDTCDRSRSRTAEAPGSLSARSRSASTSPHGPDPQATDSQGSRGHSAWCPACRQRPVNEGAPLDRPGAQHSTSQWARPVGTGMAEGMNIIHRHRPAPHSAGEIGNPPRSLANRHGERSPGGSPASTARSPGAIAPDRRWAPSPSIANVEEVYLVILGTDPARARLSG